MVANAHWGLILCIVACFQGATARRYWEIDASKSSNQKGLLNVINKESHSSQLYRDKKIYLEEGDSRGGLVHIMERHGSDFERKFNVTGKQAVADKIKSIVKYGDWCTYGFQKDSRGGFTLCYQIHEKLFLLVVVSDKGFIVSSYPKDRLTGHWDYKVKKGKKQKKEKE